MRKGEIFQSKKESNEMIPKLLPSFAQRGYQSESFRITPSEGPSYHPVSPTYKIVKKNRTSLLISKIESKNASEVVLKIYVSPRKLNL